MITISAESNNLWQSIREILSVNIPFPEDGLRIKIKGGFTAEHKLLVTNRINNVHLVPKECEVYASAIDDENCMDLFITLNR